MEKKGFDFVATPVTKLYGENCFSQSVMKERLPKSVFKEFQKVLKGEIELSFDVATVVATSMKDWAVEKGATHFTHWFQPLTGVTAEKHDSFINPTADGNVIMEFSGKELIQGEPDASSFPNGGLRDTFEARGYTAWDVSSPVFLKEDNTGITLYIPTAFVSYTGEALDKKVPLLRSMEVIGREALRALKALGNTTSKNVYTTVGAEQEYFLIDEEFYSKRSDLMLSGRTVFGAMPAKGQELDDHYFGSIKDRVAAFMRELDLELWKLGVASKTKHNEVAPNQFELASIFTSSNVATDNNQLVMETIKKIAGRQKLVALLHEKPFAGVNGSGKHNNWSMATDDGINLLEPGKNPEENIRFLLVLAAVIKAVDKYASLLRMSAGNAGNDHRLGANEAPPAIISIFLGEQLSEVVEKIANGEAMVSKEGIKMEFGTTSIPRFSKDLTDRNRTSPFAFTGNKFEFRMVGSSQSVSGPNVVLNTAVAEALGEFSDILEKSDDKMAAVKEILTKTYKEHGRVVFNGDGYAAEWLVEAEKRGLPNLKSTIEALPELVKDYSVNLFSKFKIFTKEELESRLNIYLEEYNKQINIEAGVAISMANIQIIPAVIEFASSLGKTVLTLNNVNADSSAIASVLKEVLENLNGLKTKIEELSIELEAAQELEENLLVQAKAYREKVFSKLEEARIYADKLETIVDKRVWPFPTYEDLLFRL